MAVEVTSTPHVKGWSGYVQMSARRNNGDKVFITGDFRWEVEQVRRLLMKAARGSRMRMIQIAELTGLAEMENQLPPNEEEEYLAAQLAVVEIETLDLPSLGYVPEPEDAVDLEQAMLAFQRDVVRCSELAPDSSLEFAIAVAANSYRWARFWVERHPSPKVRAMFAAALGEAEPIRADTRRLAERQLERWAKLNG